MIEIGKHFSTMSNVFLPQTPGRMLRRSRKERGFNLRPYEPGDAPLVVNFLKSLSPHTIFRRFMLPYPSLSDDFIWREINRLSQVQALKGTVLLATVYRQGKEEVIALGELARDRENMWVAELGLVIRDDYQGEGVGSMLVQPLVQQATRQGIATLQAETQAQNLAMIRIWAKMGLPYTCQIRQGVASLTAQISMM